MKSFLYKKFVGNIDVGMRVDMDIFILVDVPNVKRGEKWTY